MKVREKSTGDIIEVTPIMKYSVHLGQYYESVEDAAGRELNLNDVEVIESKDTSIPDCGEGAMYIDPSISYWERLKHQYAGMAMQGILTNPIGFENIRVRGTNIQIETALLASEFAHALVEKMKENEKAMH